MYANERLIVLFDPRTAFRFFEWYSTAQMVYDRDKADLKKLSPDGVINFQKLLYMEIQYSGRCVILWITVGQAMNGASGGGGSEAKGAGGGGGSDSNGASQIPFSILDRAAS